MLRLIDHLRATGLSNRDARAALSSGKVWVAGVPTADPGREVDPAAVELRPRAPRITVGRDLVVLWRDDHLAVVWKPARMLSVPAPRRHGTHVLAEVGGILGTVYPVHRLDEGTSGVMMVARTEEAQQGLKALLETHEVERRYLAIGAGALSEDPFTVRTHLVRDRGDGRRGSGEGDGREAITHLRRIERLGRHSLVEATLETGRTHQVRIHLAEQGCPLLGDTLYAPPHVAARAPRLALHAAVLGFVHPITGEKLRFEAPLADDLLALARRLRESPRSSAPRSRKPAPKRRR